MIRGGEVIGKETLGGRHSSLKSYTTAVPYVANQLDRHSAVEILEKRVYCFETRKHSSRGVEL